MVTAIATHYRVSTHRQDSRITDESGRVATQVTEQIVAGDALFKTLEEYGVRPALRSYDGGTGGHARFDGGVEWLSWEPITEMRPNNTTARVLRPHLRAAGVEHLVRKIGSGRKRTHVHMAWLDDDGAREAAVRQVAEALRPLWHDGAARVRIVYSGLIVIERADWYRTMPDTPEGLAALETREGERNAALLAAIGRGATARTGDYVQVTWRPSADDPRRPWVDRYAGSYTPFEVAAYGDQRPEIARIESEES